MTALVVVKFPAETKLVTLDLTPDLAPGETVVSATIGGIAPATLAAIVSSTTTVGVVLAIGAGVDLQSYGVTVNIVTSMGTTTRLLAVVCNSQLANNYQNVNLDAFASLVGSLEVGQAAVGNVSFMLDQGADASSGVVDWEILDASGRVYSSGTSFNYLVTALASATKVEAQAVVNVPSNSVPTLDGQSYQVRWRLTVNGKTYFSYESLTVTSLTSSPIGVEDVVDLEGADIPVGVVFPTAYETVTYELYDHANGRITNATPYKAAQQLSSGWYYSGEFLALATPLPAQLEPYTILWTGRNAARPLDTDRQTGRVFVVNSSMLQAVADLRLTLNKSRSTIAHEEDLLFTEAILLSYLRSGRDYFNGAGLGMITAFTMVNAQGSIREFWIRSALVSALRAQYLAEGEKAFNFSGQAISLDIDRTQYYQGLADQLKSELDQELKPYKQNLIKKGITGGDGNLDPAGGLGLKRGALGTVGITLSPASASHRFGTRWRVG